jgi:hypothetical protein
MVRNILNYLGDVIGTLELPDDTSEAVWTEKLAKYAVAPPSESELWEEAALRSYNDANEFGKRVVASLKGACDVNDFSEQQRVWLQHRLRAVTVSIGSGDSAVVDMMNLVVAGEAAGALYTVRQMTPDALDKPYHCLTAELIYGLKAMLLDYLKLPPEAP